MAISIGIDLSLTKTGYVVIHDGGKVLVSGLIKSKPNGDTPINEVVRIRNIIHGLKAKIDECLSYAPDTVVIEGLAFMAQGTSLVQLAGLNYLLRSLLVDLGWPFVIVAPTSLKKFITGSGRGDKDMIMMAIYKNYGFEAADNNIADAFGLAAAGMALLDTPIIKLLKPQREVIKLLKKQI